MVSLIVHALLGLAVIVAIVALNPGIFRQHAIPKVSVLEAVYYVVGVAAIPLCWYFNIRFVTENAHGVVHNPLWGPGSWAEFIRLGYATPPAGSNSNDFIIGNVILLPLFTIVDGRRRGVGQPWLYFVCSLLTSFSFAWAFYLATVERQRRLTPSLLTEPQLTDPNVR
jgi:hypothetical protein